MAKLLIEYFYEKEKKWADRPYLHQPFGDTWETYTWGEVGVKARRLATWLKKQCPKEQAHISIVSRNCREWAIADIAIMMAGFINVPFYSNLDGKQLSEVIEIGDVDLILFGKVDGWEQMKTGLPKGIHVGKFPHYQDNPIIDIGTDWTTIMQEEPMEGDPLPDPDSIWSIIFTSGTTGTPKGAFFTQKKVSALLDSPHFQYWFKMEEEMDLRILSFLPLNHIAERSGLLSSLRLGIEVFFTENLDSFFKNLLHARPSSFFAVPRVWKKFQQGILSKLPQEQLDKLLADPETKEKTQYQLLEGLGLEKTLIAFTGAAPMAKYDIEWWVKVGLPLSNAYGQTENFALSSFSPIGEIKPGAVGFSHTFAEIKLDPDSKELLVKSPLLMDGYYKDEEKTAETIQDGWLHTGDAGKFDDEGYLYITGRVKDTFKTEKGQFIVPAKIENLYGGNSDIEQLCLLGLGMPHPIMVLVPSEIGAAKNRRDFENSVRETMEATNSDLPNYTKVGTVLIAKEPWTIENGLMTPTLKVRRFNMHEKYAENMRGYCEDDKKIIWEE